MDTTVRDHINCLKSRIDVLGKHIMGDACTPDERKKYQVEIGIASLALAHYEAALKEEQKLPHEILRQK